MRKNFTFWKSAVNRGAQVLFSLLLVAALFFLSVGKSNVPRAWFYFGLYFVSLVMNMIIFIKYNPEVVKARSKILKGKMKWWDKVYAMSYTVLMLTIPIVCGLDVRFNTSALGIEYYIVAILLFILGWSFTSWAMVANKYFEGSIRIQKERDHKVVSTGPYSIIRHPGYAGMILFYTSMPLGLGSLYGLVPVLLLTGAFIFRIHFEDKMLQQELEGYKEYTKRTRYRLIPGIW